MIPAERQDPRAAAPQARHLHGWKIKALLLVASLAFSALLAEGILRAFFGESLSTEADERCLLYRYNRLLGWFPIPNSTNRFTGSRTITVANNRLGFRDRDPARSNKPRVLVIGDSFVWGFDVEARERFTDLLQLKHPEWDLYNAGVSGYGTDQEFLLLQQIFDEYKPAVVLLIFCSQTDHDDNSRNARYAGYYKPYYVEGPGGEELELKGVPVPKFERAFCAEHKLVCKSYLAHLVVRAVCKLSTPPTLQLADPTARILLAMRRFVVERGAVFGVGIEGLESPYRPMEEFLEACHIPYIGLGLGEITPERYHSLGDHWTPKGHAFVAERLDGFLCGLVGGSAVTRPSAVTDLQPEAAVIRFRTEIAPFQAKNLSTKDAIAAYRASLRFMPDLPEALNNLAWILASDSDPSCRDGAEAVRLAERACALTGRKRAKMIGTLAAAYAEAGRFDEAVAVGEEASRLADATGDHSLSEANRKLAALYRLGKPYHEPKSQ